MRISTSFGTSRNENGEYLKIDIEVDVRLGQLYSTSEPDLEKIAKCLRCAKEAWMIEWLHTE